MDLITGRIVTAKTEAGKVIAGMVMLVYTDALASGSNEYIPITFIKVKDDKGVLHDVRPRDLINTVG